MVTVKAYTISWKTGDFTHPQLTVIVPFKGKPQKVAKKGGCSCDAQSRFS